MKRSKHIFEKDELEATKKFDKDQLQTKLQAKHNAIVASFRVINLDEELKNGPCTNYESYNALVRSGDDCTKSDDLALLRLAKSTTQSLDTGSSISTQIIPIQRYPLVFNGSPPYVDIVKKLQYFIFRIHQARDGNSQRTIPMHKWIHTIY